MPAARSSPWLWLIPAVLAADRATKLAIERSTPEGYRRELLPGVAWLVHSTNSGIAFGFFSGSASQWITVLLAVAAAAVILLLVWLLVSGRAGMAPAQAGLALIAGGAAGNLFDRLAHGGVTDFLELHAGRLEWPAFNLADSAITIGALLVILELVGGGSQAAKERA
jgi:signal peptidase II